MNLVAIIMQYLAPALLNRVAASLGIQSPILQKAIAAILPTILAGLAGAAARPGGARKLDEVVKRQDPNILGDLGNIFGGPKAPDVAKRGNGDLGDILGGPALSGLTSAVSKFAGVGDDAVKSLTGLIGPVALGALAKAQAEKGLDAAGLGNLLASQKQNIQAAMPAGFGDLLKGTGLLDSIQAPSATVHKLPDPAPSAQKGMGMWPLIVAALALAVIGWNFWGRGPATVALPTPPSITVGGQNIGSQLGTAAEQLRSTLAGLTDEASAKSALPKLQDMAKQLGGVREQADKLPADGKRALAGYAAQLLPVIRPLIERAIAASGYGPLVKPVLEQILNRIEAMAKA
ncbi:MAG: DUF937 domain-containing protein [Proteobacteria bacterium]|nr:DUF937 domain-containing protein [Pseudomonadota bacterium]